MHECLSVFTFGPDILVWVNTFYSKPITTLNNGFLSSPFNVHKEGGLDRDTDHCQYSDMSVKIQNKTIQSSFTIGRPL